ncbi:hypothetical protein PR202_gb10896 [Eleusine coracana subsp. coracana]|uniref:Uncharacterized protein n=1 Tax=Eleusine coracana subsp. coracana TaxID=191504 RepID=A0AAV5EL60_ELECO|nr:hypothetical protein PR202_gb10896 [Eleusine coracana subsp. coracana]
MMELSHYLVDHGVKVTFVNTELNHRLILGALSTTGDTNLGGVDLVSIPDGLGDGASRTDLGRLTDSFSKVMPAELEKLISRISGQRRRRRRRDQLADRRREQGVVLRRGDASRRPRRRVLPVIGGDVRDADQDPRSDTRQRNRRRRVGQAARRIPAGSGGGAGHGRGGDLVEPRRRRPRWPAAHLPAHPPEQRGHAPGPETVVCNSVQELEPGTFALFPGRVVPVGPLSSDKPVTGSFWAQDATCTAWLDARSRRAPSCTSRFGSIASSDASQLVELAEGLALTGRAFLWVARPGSAGQAHEQLLDRLRRIAGPRGRVAVASGVPMLCWPYFADQFLNQRYICDVWRTGVQVVVAGSGTGRVERDAVRAKVEELLGDAELKERARALRDVARRAVGEGGSSRRNLKRFVDLVRGSAS